MLVVMQKIRMGDMAFGTVAAFLLGVFSANIGWNSYVFFGMGISLAIVSLFFAQGRRLYKCMIIFFVAAIVGVFYYHAYIGWQMAHTHLPTGKDVAFLGTVATEPVPAGNFMMFALETSHPYAGMVDIFTSPHSQFRYGDLLWIKGTVESSQDTDEAPAVFFPQAKMVAHDGGVWWRALLIDIKSSIVQKFDQVFSVDQAGLLAGIIIGATSTLGTTLKAQMESSGTSYITGMYGYKIAIISLTLATALKDHMPRKTLLWITLAAVALFVVASGGSVSAVRAAIMGSFALVARASGRVFSARNAVAFAALGMVIFNATILTDAGFQLSFLSFLGIYQLGRPLKRYFHWTDNGFLQWKEHVILSLATNLAILPIVMNVFGGFSLTSFISNVLIMIPWPVIMAGGVTIIALGFISSYVTFFAVQATKLLLQYELLVIHIFSVWIIPLPSVFNSVSLVALYYGVLIIFAYYYAAPPQENY